MCILEQGIWLCQHKDKPSADDRATSVTMSVIAAVLSQELGLHELARKHKGTAERLVKAEPILSGAWPAMNEADQKRYDSIRLPKAGK